jgi:D-alanyl-D-alanine-carboxypeptidase/D-alanyl-D-alanine-endopeptidase
MRLFLGACRCRTLPLALTGPCLVLGLVAGPAAAVTPPPDGSIQALLDERVARIAAGGIVLAIRDADGATKVFHSGTSGRAGLALDGDTLFEIGSITKTFTAALLGDMVLRGELKLDDPVERYLPPDMTPPTREGRRITFLDLATHTSGLPALPTNIHPRDVANPYADYTVEMLKQFLAGYTLPRDIGSQYEYSAVGFGLLGHALAHRLDEPWEKAIRERVLDPLGMTSTRATLGPALRARLAEGHDGAGHPAPSWDIPALPAMGALHTSGNDLLKYLAANVDTASGPLGRALALCQAPRVDMDEETRVGLAWQAGHATNRTIVWHGGGTGGYRALIAFEPMTRRGVVVLSNSAAGADDIGFHLLDPTLPLD